MGIEVSKLSVALPWYGYDYVCSDLQPGKDCIPVPAGGYPNRQPGLGQVLDLHADLHALHALHAAVGAPPIVFNPGSVSKHFVSTCHTASFD